MEQVETCFICGTSDSVRDLGVWFLDSDPRPIHVACWIAAYKADSAEHPDAA